MPPSSRRATRPRKAAEATAEVSDAETPESIATPSRTSRKRARGNNDAASSGRAATRRKTRDTRAHDREDTEGTEAQEPSDAETEPSVPPEIEVISKLKVADKFVHATEDYSNALLEGKEHVPGYGKIAGRNWTYIIQGVEVNIGRPEQHERPNDTQEVASSQPAEGASSAKSKIDIDLGPDRQISRLHAIITYDSDAEQWFIIVNGRNGLRVDTSPLKRGARFALRSGSVIDICGTQMAFITTARHENDGPVFAEAIIRQTYTSEEDEPEHDPRANGNGHSHPGQSGGNSSARRPQHPSSSFQDGTTMRFHPQSQASAQGHAFQVPGTPVRNHPPMQIPTSRTKPSPASVGGYSRGVMIESTESIDYSAEGAKDLKPPHSYAQLIGMAILSTSEQQMTLNNIYKWIMSNYAFYRFNTGGWQNSIRHNLSLNKAFEKIARRTDEPGKGMKWMIAPQERENFLSQGMKGCRRPNPTPSDAARGPSGGSNPSSPAQLGPQALAHARLNGAVNGIPTKVEPSASPPMSSYNTQQYPSYPTAQEAYTPDRGSRRQGIKFDDNDPELVYPASAKSTLNHLTAVANAAGSPPSLYINDDGRVGPLDTPFPMRSSQKLAPPSTLQRPSAFMEFSSPAPFWKFGSTPLRPIADMSPLKTPFSNFRPLGNTEVKLDEEDDKDAVDKKSMTEEKDDDMPVVQSSPPRPSTGHDDPIDASPTRSIPRPATSHSRTKFEHGDDNTQSPVQGRATSTPFDQSADMGRRGSTAGLPTPAESAHYPSAHAPTTMRPPSQSSGYNYTTTPQPQPASSNMMNAGINGLANAAASIGSMRYNAEADDDAGIDLAKGFQPIGAFHKMGAARFGLGMAGR